MNKGKIIKIFGLACFILVMGLIFGWNEGYDKGYNKGNSEVKVCDYCNDDRELVVYSFKDYEQEVNILCNKIYGSEEYTEIKFMKVIFSNNYNKPILQSQR